MNQTTVPALDRSVGAADGAPDLHFPDGLIGLPQARRFVLVELDAPGVYELRSLDVDEAQFVVVAPGAFFPRYAPTLDDATVRRLGVSGAEDVLTFLVVTLGAGGAEATANLMAPLVLNRHTRTGLQVVLDPAAYPLRASLLTG